MLHLHPLDSIKIRDQSSTNIILLRHINPKLEIMGTFWVEILHQTIWEIKNLLVLFLIISRQLCSKAIPSSQVLNYSRRILSPLFRPAKRPSLVNPLFSILILTKTAAPIIREVILPKERVSEGRRAIRRGSLRGKIAAPKMKDLHVQTTKKLIILMVISIKAHGKIKTQPIKVSHWDKLMTILPNLS